MTSAVVITATDTGIGKTVFAAALAAALDSYYWKPVQAGLAGETDSEAVARLSGLDRSRILPEAYRLNTPASPHYAAERDGVVIDLSGLAIPKHDRPVVIEGAGGVLVPITRHILQADLFQRWKAPVILCASTRLGTINHSMLSIEALKRRGIAILGVAFIGSANPDSEETIAAMSGVARLGRLPHLDPLNAATLKSAFAKNFDVARILGIGTGGP